MKYYIYISDTKVDMLYPQIPKSLLKKIASSLNIDLKLLGAEINVGAKGNPSEETRYSKVKIVSEYIEKHLDVGWVDAHKTYFKGSLPMNWNLIPDMRLEATSNKKSVLVYFGVNTPLTILGLVGSVRHLIANKDTSTLTSENSFINGYLYRPLKELLATEGKSYSSTASLFDLIILKNSGTDEPKQNIEFLAKTLFYEKGPVLNYSRGTGDSRDVLVGTPIYVALTD